VSGNLLTFAPIRVHSRFNGGTHGESPDDPPSMTNMLVTSAGLTDWPQEAQKAQKRSHSGLLEPCEAISPPSELWSHSFPAQSGKRTAWLFTDSDKHVGNNGRDGTGPIEPQRHQDTEGSLRPVSLCVFASLWFLPCSVSRAAVRLGRTTLSRAVRERDRTAISQDLPFVRRLPSVTPEIRPLPPEP
jgi:hypothetical protein